MNTTETGAPVPMAWILAGHYFRVLALSSLLTTAFSLFHDGHLRLDFSFMLLFSIARGVMTGRKGWRTVAVVICAALVVSFLIASTYSHFTEDLREAIWSPRTTIHLAVLDCVQLLVLALFPLTFLLRPRLLGTVAAEEAVEATRWTRPRLARYVLAALLLGGVSTAVDSAAGRIELQTSFTGFKCGNQAVSSVLTNALTDGAKMGPLFISSWVIGESNSSSSGISSSSIRTITIGNRTVRPDIHPHRYLKLLETPAEPSDLANVVLVRADGRVVPIQRRVTPATYGPALTAIMAASDFDDLQRKLEAALPAVPRTFPPELY